MVLLLLKSAGGSRNLAFLLKTRKIKEYTAIATTFDLGMPVWLHKTMRLRALILFTMCHLRDRVSISKQKKKIHEEKY